MEGYIVIQHHLVHLVDFGVLFSYDECKYFQNNLSPVLVFSGISPRISSKDCTRFFRTLHHNLHRHSNRREETNCYQELSCTALGSLLNRQYSKGCLAFPPVGHEKFVLKDLVAQVILPKCLQNEYVRVRDNK